MFLFLSLILPIRNICQKGLVFMGQRLFLWHWIFKNKSSCYMFPFLHEQHYSQKSLDSWLTKNTQIHFTGVISVASVCSLKALFFLEGVTSDLHCTWVICRETQNGFNSWRCGWAEEANATLYRPSHCLSSEAFGYVRCWGFINRDRKPAS